MRKSRSSEEQFVGFLKQIESGVAVKDLCRKHGFSDATFYHWRIQYGGMEVGDVRRLRELEFAAAWGPRHAGSPMQVAEV